ncbi:hypothetical protein TA3x_003293 [Tundrisphaera sp. TA3]|uniref:hypothetical protein n=1 Tax=Tundrisphaera sp. TA3 TaxID=3435775 RepID=UPI003EBC7A2F
MVIRQGLINATLLGWAAVVLVLFRVLGPRRAGLIAAFGGLLLLPPGQVMPRLHPAIPLTSTTVVGLSILLGMIAFGRPWSRPARLSGPDLALLAYALAPAAGVAVRGPSAMTDAVDTILYRSLTWVVPYAFARLYLADRDGPRDVARGVVASGVFLLPIIAYESLVGPDRYLLGMIFGMPFRPEMVERMGGYRPEAFFNNGIHLASWMAIASVASCWLALARTPYPGKVPGWIPAALVLGGSMLCRGMYGLLLLGAGLLTMVITQFGRTRGAIVILALIAPTYMATRISGAWDGRALVAAAGSFGRPDTVKTRIDSEDGILAAIRARGLAWGDGLNLWVTDRRPAVYWPDGKWLFPLWLGGAIGLAMHYAAIHLIPIGVAISAPRGRPSRVEAASPVWCLATLSALHMIDGLHNGVDFLPTAMMAGAIVSATPVAAFDDTWPRRVGRLALIGVLVALPELVGLAMRLARRQ